MILVILVMVVLVGGELVVMEEELELLPLALVMEEGEVVEEVVVPGICTSRSYHYWVQGAGGHQVVVNFVSHIFLSFFCFFLCYVEVPRKPSI